MKFDFSAWLHQPTTITGLASAAAGIGGMLAHMTFSDPRVSYVVGGIAFVLTHLAVDDHSAVGVAEKAALADALAIAGGATADAAKTISDAFDLIIAIKGADGTPIPMPLTPPPA